METDHLLLRVDLQRSPTFPEQEANLKYLERIALEQAVDAEVSATAAGSARTAAESARDAANQSKIDAAQSKADAAASAVQALDAKQDIETLLGGASQPDAGELTGDEAMPTSRGTGLLKTTLTKIAQWSLQTYQGFTQSGAGATPRTLQDRGRDTISVRDFITTAINGTTSNQAGIVDAVAEAYARGAELLWPAGTYVSDANIPNFHNVAHVGKGVIKRGSDTWKISGKTGTNILYVTTSGSDANDGLSVSQPRLTVQSASDALKNWQGALLTDCVFRIQLGAGTWNASISVVGLRSKNRIEFCGPNVGGHPNVPTAIIDGTGQSDNGWFFQQYMLVKVQDIKFTNWNIHGLIAAIHSNLWTINVHTFGNGAGDTSNSSGIDVEAHTRLYVSGGLHNNPGNSVRVYANCVATIGYQGSASSNRPQISGSAAGCAGVLIRDSSSAHVDYCDITACLGSGGGVYGINNARIHIMECTVTGNYYNVRLDAGSTYINSGSTISGATTGKDVVEFGMSIDNANLGAWYFDSANVRWRLGLTTNLSPQAMLHLIAGAGAGAVSYNANSRQIIESDSNAHLTFGTPGGSTEAGIVAAKPGVSLQGKFVYTYTDDTWRMQLAGVDAFRFGVTFLSPITDNAKTLGLSTARWSNLYSTNVVLTPPASVTPASNGQMTFQLTSNTQLTIKVKGSDGVVRSANLTLA